MTNPKPLTAAQREACKARNPGNVDVLALLADGEYWRQAYERLQQACDIFEKNSEVAAKLEAVLRRCLPLVEATGVAHMRKSNYRLATVYGEEMAVREEPGCVSDCPGCRREKERDAVLEEAREALGESSNGQPV